MDEHRPSRILLIDDDPDMRFAVQLILAPPEFEVRHCATGAAGLEQMRRERPLLVLLDIMLGQPTEGLQVACQMRQDPNLRDIPIIFVSSIDESLEREYAREVCPIALDADMFVEKPLDAATLRSAVTWTLSQRPRGPSRLV